MAANVVTCPLPDSIRDEIDRMEDLSSIFPLQVDGTKYVELSTLCPCCGKHVRINSLKGIVTRNKYCVSINGTGLCIPCNTWSPFQVRLRGDNTMLVFTSNGWVEQKLAPRKGFRRLIDLIFGDKNV